MNRLTSLKIILPLILTTALIIYCAGTKAGSESREITRMESRNLAIDSTLSPDPELEALIQPYRIDLDDKMSVVIGHAALDLKKGKPEAPLNNFVADLMLKRASREFRQPVNVALTNNGGLRVDIQSGPITLGKIYEVMPFENELVILQMTGAQLITLAKEIGEEGGEAISGMRLEFQDQNLARITVQDQPVAGDSLYYLVTTDYLSGSGRNQFNVLSLAPKTLLGITLRDAIVDEVKEIQAAGGQVTAQIDGRIVFRKSGE
jgi:2',3'-cyclic-nucleotide 2'-phosphodiesterase (5'-nucleotidase family)